jgi:hypothetical protein
MKHVGQEKTFLNYWFKRVMDEQRIRNKADWKTPKARTFSFFLL